MEESDNVYLWYEVCISQGMPQNSILGPLLKQKYCYYYIEVQNFPEEEKLCKFMIHNVVILNYLLKIPTS